MKMILNRVVVVVQWILFVVVVIVIVNGMWISNIDAFNVVSPSTTIDRRCGGTSITTTRFISSAALVPSSMMISAWTRRLCGKSDDDDDDDIDEEDMPVSDRNNNDDDDDAVAMGPAATNVLGTTLCSCCSNVGGDSGIGTGYYRNGYCSTGQDDIGRHTVCVQVTDDFLTFSQAVGNDLSTRMPQYLFPGLKHGDIWCLCAERWVQAYEAGMAPKLFLKATHEKTLDYVSFDVLREYAIDKNEADTIINTLNEQRERLNKLL